MFKDRESVISPESQDQAKIGEGDSVPSADLVAVPESYKTHRMIPLQSLYVPTVKHFN